MPDEHSVHIEIPPAWWWEQEKAARLEAERRSPIAVENVRVVIRRTGQWRPGRPGHFVAVLRHADASEPSSPTSEGAPERTDMLALLAAGAFVIACTVIAINVHPLTAPAVLQTSSADDEAVRFEPVEVAVRDLALVTSAMPNAQMTTIGWSTEAITISGSNLDIEAAQRALQSVAPGRVVSNGGAPQPVGEAAP